MDVLLIFKFWLWNYALVAYWAAILVGSSLALLLIVAKLINGQVGYCRDFSRLDGRTVVMTGGLTGECVGVLVCIGVCGSMCRWVCWCMPACVCVSDGMRMWRHMFVGVYWCVGTYVCWCIWVCLQMDMFV